MAAPEQLPVKVQAFLHPLRSEFHSLTIEEGRTVFEILGEAAPHVFAYIGGYRVPRELWKHVRPKAGTLLTVRVLASGSGDDENKGMRTVLQIVVAVASIYASGAGYAYLGAFIAGAGGYAINALVPPPTPQNLLAGDSFNRLRAITGTQNQFNPFGVVPRVYGRHRLFPPYAAKPFTEVVGEDQYLRALFCLGYGPLDVTDLQIGETPIVNFEDVEYEIGDTPGTLFSNGVSEESLSVVVQLPTAEVESDEDRPFVSRTTSPDTVEISIDLLFPNGVGAIAQSPARRLFVWYTVEYREVSGGSWLNIRDADGLQFSNARAVVDQTSLTLESQYPFDEFIAVTGIGPTPFRTGLRWKTPAAGQYEVRITPELLADEEDGVVDEAVSWNPDTETFLTEAILITMRSVLDRAVVPIPGVEYLAIRIKATDQLNGVLDSINVVVQSRLQVWDGSDMVEEATSNPAWVFLDIACGIATERALDPETRFNLDELKDWADDNDTAGRQYNAVIDTPTTVFSLMRDVASVGRAAYANRNGLHTVVRDIQGLTPVQVFTPRNSWGFSAGRGFSDLPHALRVRWVNPDKGWQQDEFVVYDDGYTAATATKYEVLEQRGVTIRQQAFKEARYQLAARRLRPELHNLSTDVENLACTRGDLVHVQQDSIAVGLASGRVAAVDGADVLLDTQVEMEAGGLYSIRFRLADGTQEIESVFTAEGATELIALVAPVAGLAAGDLFAFGETGTTTVACKVNRVIPGPDLSAQLQLLPEAEGVYTAEDAEDDDPDSEIGVLNPELPPVPKVYVERSDEQVLLEASDGSLQSRIVAYFGFLSGSGQKVPVSVEGQYQQAGQEDAWQSVPVVPARSGQVSFLPVTDGAAYALRLRSIAADGSASDWSGAITHTVVGKTTPPPDVTSLFINGRTLNWTYPIKPKDFAGFEVRYQAGVNDNWEDGIPAHSGLVGGPPFLMQNVPAGQRTIMVKGIDQAGNESTEPAILITDFGDPLVDNVALLYDYQAAGYPGTVTNGSPSLGNLVADGATLFWEAGSDTDRFWATDGAALFWAGGEYLEMTYEFAFTPEASVCGIESELVCEPTVTAQAWSMDFRLAGGSYFWAADDGAAFWGADADEFWSEAVGEWQPWPGRLESVTRQEYQFRIITSGGFTQGVIADVDMIVDVPDVVDKLADIAIGASGTNITLSKSFRAIVNVQATLQDDGGNARTVKIINKDFSGFTGPLLQAFDSSGVGTTAVIDVTVQGY